MEPINTYTDFRQYLKDFYQERKKENSLYSYRTFNKLAGIQSPSHFKEVMCGRRCLTLKSLPKFIKGLGLHEGEARYFTAMVRFTMAKNEDEKLEYLEQMRGALPRVRPSVIPVARHKYYMRWYNAVVRELVCMCKWNGDYKRLASHIRPHISIKEARESVALLLELGFIKRKPDGTFEQADLAMTTGSDVISSAVRKRNRDLGALGIAAIEEYPPAIRDISSMVVGITAKGYGLIKRELQKLKQRIAEIACEDKGSDQAYAINLQLFPVSGRCPISAGKQ